MAGFWLDDNADPFRFALLTCLWAAGLVFFGHSHDKSGNMIVAPDGLKPGEKRHLVYDAWNRLVGVRQDNGGVPGALIATYRYNGLGHRVTKLLGSDPENPDTTIDYYYAG